MGEREKLNEFEPVTYQAWREIVAKDLGGAPFEKKLVKRVAGIDIEPLYVPGTTAPDAAGLPGFAPFTRGSFALGGAEMGWDVRSEVSHSTPALAARVIQEELDGGASSIALKVANGSEPGTPIANLAELEEALTHVALDRVPVSLSAGSVGFEAACALIAAIDGQKAKRGVVHGSLGLDPLGTLASQGTLAQSLDDALNESAALAVFAARELPGMRTVQVDGSPYHEAGADAVNELGIALATGVAYLRALTAAGLDVSQAAKQIGFTFSVGRDFFVEMAKLRAARRCWARVVEAAGGDESAQAMIVHARTSFRTKTQRDPWVNLLRATAESFAAAAGGADVITTASFDVALGESDEFARRLSRNTQHLLRHESHVHRVVDPAGGSFYLEEVTEALSQGAWSELQRIERVGGIAEALTRGDLAARLQKALDSERKAVETRKLAITGVNEFPHAGEEPVTRPLGAHAHRAEGKALTAFDRATLVESSVAALQRGASFADLRATLASTPASAPRLVRERLSAPFESLRDLADRFAQKRGQRPGVFLANLGPIPEHKARATYAQNYFEAGGFRVLTNNGFATGEEAAQAFAQSNADVACLCGSDATYAAEAEPAARALAANGARVLVLAGAPGDAETAYRTAGVTDFIFVGSNVYTTLRSLLERVGAE